MENQALCERIRVMRKNAHDFVTVSRDSVAGSTPGDSWAFGLARQGGYGEQENDNLSEALCRTLWQR